MKRILYVIVLYKQKYRDTLSYRTLLWDVNQEDVLIFDNSPVTSVYGNCPHNIISQPNNPGLSSSYNKAAKYARDNGYEWIMVLDQDTTFPEGAIDAYLKTIDEHSDVKMIAPCHKIANGVFISPVKYFCKFGRNQDSVKTGVVSFTEASPINSGLLINLDAFEKVGGYDEDVTLDFSDIRFIEKFKTQYSKFYVLEDVVCLQDFSVNERDPNKLIGRFNIFLKCAKACKREHWSDGLQYFICTFKRCMKLTLVTRSTMFLKSYYKYYIL